MSCACTCFLAHLSATCRCLLGLQEKTAFFEAVCVLWRPCRCPYFLTRELQAGAELILVPYIYLLDKDKRKSLTNLDLHNAVLIFDEAHNLVRAPRAGPLRCLHSMQHRWRWLWMSLVRSPGGTCAACRLGQQAVGVVCAEEGWRLRHVPVVCRGSTGGVP